MRPPLLGRARPEPGVQLREVPLRHDHGGHQGGLLTAQGRGAGGALRGFRGGVHAVPDLLGSGEGLGAAEARRDLVSVEGKADAEE